MKRPIAWTLVILLAVAAWGKKKRQITMSEFPLIGVVYMDALDTSGMYHVDDYSCTDGDSRHAPVCGKDIVLFKFRLANSKAGPFHLVQDQDLDVDLAIKLHGRSDPLNQVLGDCINRPVNIPDVPPSHKEQMARCDTNIHYREEGTYIYVPYLAGKDKKGNDLIFEAKYLVAAIDARDLRDEKSGVEKQ